MNLLGVHLTLMIGEKLPRPVPIALAEALQSVEVSHNDQGPSGFQLTFHVGRATALDLFDYRLLTNPLLKPFNRVILVVRFAIAPEVLMDGIITNHQLNPSNEPGTSTLTITGEDLSVMMDLKQEPQEFGTLSDYGIVKKIVESYGHLGLALLLPPPPNPQVHNPRNTNEEKQNKPGPITDRAYLQSLAQQYGFLFYLTPGPIPGVSQIHWGPPQRLAIPQRALSVNMGPATNVESINFRFDALRPEQVQFKEGDSMREPITSPSFTRNIPLAKDRPEARRITFSTDEDPKKAEITAKGAVDRSFDEVVTATGQLDAMRYNGLLNPRGLVGVRGVGNTYDGLYYVKSVTHSISKGRYTQGFSLAREGTGTNTGFILS
jgi:hypothetical protein